MKHVRSITIALLAGAAAGLLIGGVGSRIAMRIIADSINRFPELTLATLNVLLIGTLLGIAGGLIFWVVEILLPTSAWLQGLALAAALIALASVPLFLRPATGELAFNPNLARLLFSSLLVAYGLAVPFIARALERYFPAEERYRGRMTIAALVLGAPGLFVFASMLRDIFVP